MQEGGPDNFITVGRNGPLPRGGESQESPKKPGPRLSARVPPPQGRGEDAQETGPRGGRAGFRGMHGAERRYKIIATALFIRKAGEIYYLLQIIRPRLFSVKWTTTWEKANQTVISA